MIYRPGRWGYMTGRIIHYLMDRVFDLVMDIYQDDVYDPVMLAEFKLGTHINYAPEELAKQKENKS